MAKTDFEVEVKRATGPLIVAVDVGSTASRGCLYDQTGLPAGQRHKVTHAFDTADDGRSTIDPDQVVAEVVEILDALTEQAGKQPIAAVAMDTFASSLVGVDGMGRALTPCFTYADSRSAEQVRQITSEIDPARTQQRVGTRQHTSYLPARLRWARAAVPEFDRVHRWLSLGEYVHQQILGTAAASTSVASWSGMLDLRTGRWDREMLSLAGIHRDQLSPVHHPDQPLTPVCQVADRWRKLADAVWFPVIADGFASNLGTGADSPRTIAAAAATSGAMRVLLPKIPKKIPSGLWCYRVDAERSLLGGALNDVGRLASWLEDTLNLPDGLDAALTGEPTVDAPITLPYLTGERATGWAARARLSQVGVTASSTPESLARSAMEAVAFTYARVAEELQKSATGVEQILASGRVSTDLPGLLQLLADALDTPVTPVTIKRATLHGTALHALEVLSPGGERAEPTRGRTYEPRAEFAEVVAERRERFERTYDQLVENG